MKYQIDRSTKIAICTNHMIAHVTDFTLHESYECRMQQASQKVEYKRQTTLKQTVEYIVLRFVSLTCCKIECADAEAEEAS